MAQPLSNLAVGAKIKIPVKSEYQSQFGTNIVFRIADKNHSGYPANSVTLITRRIIQLLAFDGKEPSNANSGRQKSGNNNYNYSNIRQWLNSNAGAGSWYSAKHSADAPPNSSNVSVNAYDARAGFLAIFDTQFVNALMNTTLTVVKNTVTDGGSYETVTDKVFLASTTEVGLANERSIAEGKKLALFTNDASRVAYCTQEAINTSVYTNDPTTSEAWSWWLRTPNSSSSHFVRFVHREGTLDYNSAYLGIIGVRPLCNLPSGILVSDTTDADGAYTIVWWTPPNLKPKIGGVYKSYDDGWVKVNGVWKQIDEIHVKVSGAWKKSE
jgi:hypothetical protein